MIFFVAFLLLHIWYFRRRRVTLEAEMTSLRQEKWPAGAYTAISLIGLLGAS
jgi:hypothetical protein